MQHKLIETLTLVQILPESPELPVALSLLWAQMAEEKKLDWFFPSCGEGWTCEAWVDQVRRDGCRVVLVVERGSAEAGNRILGFALLAGLRPRRAFIHFACFAAAGLQVVEASRWVCDKILQAFDLDVLIGMIPETNGKAIRLGELIGFEFCGFFPFGSYVAMLRQSVTTQVYCYTNKLPASKEVEK